MRPLGWALTQNDWSPGRDQDTDTLRGPHRGPACLHRDLGLPASRALTTHPSAVSGPACGPRGRSPSRGPVGANAGLVRHGVSLSGATAAHVLVTWNSSFHLAFIFMFAYGLCFSGGPEREKPRRTSSRGTLSPRIRLSQVELSRTESHGPRVVRTRRADFGGAPPP